MVLIKITPLKIDSTVKSNMCLSYRNMIAFLFG